MSNTQFPGLIEATLKPFSGVRFDEQEGKVPDYAAQILKTLGAIQTEVKSLVGRMDAVESREEERDEREEKEREDAEKRRKDAEAEEKHREEAEKEERDMKGEFERKDGESEEEHEKRLKERGDALRKDCAFGARKDGESEEDEKKRVDSAKRRLDTFERLDKARADARKDSETEEEKEKKARADAEEEMRDDEHLGFDGLVSKLEGKGYSKEYATKIAGKVAAEKRGDSRHDSALKKELDETRAKIERMERALKPISHEEEILLSNAQMRADEVYQQLGERAPKPLPGQTPRSYRRMLAAHIQHHSPSFGKIRLDSVEDTAFDAIEAQIYSDAIAAAAAPSDKATGRLFPIVRKDASGRQITTYSQASDMDAWLGAFKLEPRKIRIRRPYAVH